MRILFVCSSGGHLAQLTSLSSWWAAHERHWVTFDTEDALRALADEPVSWAYHPTTRHLPNLARNTVLAQKVLADFRPELVVSTGAAVAFPFFVLARRKGIKTCYIEVLDRVDSRTLTGRLCYPLADAMYVQWDEQRALYPDAEVIGPTL